MNILTSRFGEIEISEELIVRMTKPVLGFEHLKKYVLIETDDFEPFKWFQSADDPDVAFVIVNPLIFFPNYVIEVNPREIEELKVSRQEDIITYAIVTIPSDFTRMTANLQGPILINSKTNLSKQLVLVNSKYNIRHRVMDDSMATRERAEKIGKVPAAV